MKISKQQKELNRQNLLSAALQLMAADGFDGVTFKQVAHKAGLSEPVVYKYFPSKEHLLFSFFSDALTRAIAKSQEYPEFATLTFSEQIQTLFDAQMSEFEPFKQVIHSSFQQLFLNSLSHSTNHVSDQRAQYSQFVSHLMDAAIAAGEFQSPPAKQIVVELLWDFHLGMTYYWLKDDSEGSRRTLQLLDKSLGFFNELLKSQILNRLTDLFYFFMREHFLNSMDKSLELSDNQKKVKAKFLKREKDSK